MSCCYEGNIILQYVWDGKGVKALDEFTLRDGGDSPGVCSLTS